MKSALLALVAVFISSTVFAQTACVVPGRGYFRIHVDSGGLFGVFAHDHLVEARKIEGCAAIQTQDLARSSIGLDFSVAELRVLDPKESAEDRAKVQKNMETEVLRVSEYPHVKFESTAVEKTDAASRLRVRGNLTIRGRTQPVVIPLVLTRMDDGTYRASGEYRFKQTLFGIEPIQLLGGTIKVKDELRVEFELFLR